MRINKFENVYLTLINIFLIIVVTYKRVIKESNDASVFERVLFPTSRQTKYKRIQKKLLSRLKFKFTAFKHKVFIQRYRNSFIKYLRRNPYYSHDHDHVRCKTSHLGLTQTNEKKAELLCNLESIETIDSVRSSESLMRITQSRGLVSSCSESHFRPTQAVADLLDFEDPCYKFYHNLFSNHFKFYSTTKVDDSTKPGFCSTANYHRSSLLSKDHSTFLIAQSNSTKSSNSEKTENKIDWLYSFRDVEFSGIEQEQPSDLNPKNQLDFDQYHDYENFIFEKNLYGSINSDREESNSVAQKENILRNNSLKTIDNTVPAKETKIYSKSEDLEQSTLNLIESVLKNSLHSILWEIKAKVENNPYIPNIQVDSSYRKCFISNKLSKANLIVANNKISSGPTQFDGIETFLVQMQHDILTSVSKVPAQDFEYFWKTLTQKSVLSYSQSGNCVRELKLLTLYGEAINLKTSDILKFKLIKTDRAYSIYYYQKTSINRELLVIFLLDVCNKLLEGEKSSSSSHSVDQNKVTLLPSLSNTDEPKKSVKRNYDANVFDIQEIYQKFYKFDKNSIKLWAFFIDTLASLEKQKIPKIFFEKSSEKYGTDCFFPTRLFFKTQKIDTASSDLVDENETTCKEQTDSEVMHLLENEIYNGSTYPNLVHDTKIKRTLINKYLTNSHATESGYLIFNFPKRLNLLKNNFLIQALEKEDFWSEYVKTPKQNIAVVIRKKINKDIYKPHIHESFLLWLARTSTYNKSYLIKYYLNPFETYTVQVPVPNFEDFLASVLTYFTQNDGIDTKLRDIAVSKVDQTKIISNWFDYQKLSTTPFLFERDFETESEIYQAVDAWYEKHPKNAKPMIVPNSNNNGFLLWAEKYTSLSVVPTIIKDPEIVQIETFMYLLYRTIRDQLNESMLERRFLAEYSQNLKNVFKQSMMNIFLTVSLCLRSTLKKLSNVDHISQNFVQSKLSNECYALLMQNVYKDPASMSKLEQIVLSRASPDAEIISSQLFQ